MMPESKTMRDTGMCEHGNFSSKCEKCKGKSSESKGYFLPEPAEKEIMPEGHAYAGHTFYRFSGEQREQVRKMGLEYDGVRYNPGDVVIAMDGKAKIIEFYPGGEITAEIDYGSDPSGHVWRDAVKQPPRLLLESLEPGAESNQFVVVAGRDNVKQVPSSNAANNSNHFE